MIKRKNDEKIYIYNNDEKNKNEINEEWIKIWVNGNMIGRLKI
jgi:hypothetical protein